MHTCMCAYVYVYMCPFSHITFPAFMQTRYTMKYRHSDSKLVVKVTDDITVSRRESLSLHRCISTYIHTFTCTHAYIWPYIHRDRGRKKEKKKESPRSRQRGLTRIRTHLSAYASPNSVSSFELIKLRM